VSAALHGDSRLANIPPRYCSFNKIGASLDLAPTQERQAKTQKSVLSVGLRPAPQRIYWGEKNKFSIFIVNINVSKLRTIKEMIRNTGYRFIFEA
jgi:hypothetical protein